MALTIAPMAEANRMPGRSDSPDGRVCLGVITAPHGVRGEVRIKCFTENPESLTAYGPLEDETGERQLAVEITGQVKGGLRARIAGCDNRDQAERLRGVKLFVDRTALPGTEEDEFYLADLEGLRVIDGEGVEIGQIKAIYNFGGSSDIIEIGRAGDKPLMLPFTREAVPSVDIGAGLVVVDRALLDDTAHDAPDNDRAGSNEAGSDETGS